MYIHKPGILLLYSHLRSIRTPILPQNQQYCRYIHSNTHYYVTATAALRNKINKSIVFVIVAKSHFTSINSFAYRRSASRRTTRKACDGGCREQDTKKGPSDCSEGPRGWRRPTLPLLRSTIGAGGLNVPVRNGKGWSPAAIATVIMPIN